MDVPKQFAHLYFHVSPRGNRDSIQKEGLKAQEQWVDWKEEPNDKGVWLSHHPEKDYGDDVWGVQDHELPNTSNNHPIAMFRQPLTKYNPDYDNEGLHIRTERDVDVSDIKRVGHIYKNPNGHTEVHWHREEDCDGR